MTLRPVVPAPGQDRLRRAQLQGARRRGRLRRARLPGAVPEVRRDAGRRPASRSRCRRSPRPSTTRPSSRSSSAAPSGAPAATRRSAAVAGYTLANDVSMRDYQYKTHQWLPGKNWAALDAARARSWSPPTRSATRTRSTSRSSSTASACRPRTRGSSSSTSRRSWRRSRSSSRCAPGDVVLTGTPSGVGYRRDPKVLLRDGDRIVVEIERVGRLENPVAAE